VEKIQVWLKLVTEKRPFTWGCTYVYGYFGYWH